MGAGGGVRGSLKRFGVGDYPFTELSTFPGQEIMELAFAVHLKGGGMEFKEIAPSLVPLGMGCFALVPLGTGCFAPTVSARFSAIHDVWKKSILGMAKTYTFS